LALLDFLQRQELLRADAPGAGDRLLARARRQRPRLADRLRGGFLFWRLPLVRPDRFLERTLPLVRPLYTPAAAAILLLITLLGIYLAGRQWDLFLATFGDLASPGGALALLLALGLSKSLHELGHAYTAKRHGLRVPVMGIGFMLFVPLLYTETSDAWRLRERHRRLAISGAGILVEIALAGIATLAWSLLADGPWRWAAFHLATAAWLISLGVNLTPFMRWDGYYLLSDYWRLPNLQQRAFELGRWQLREWLFGPRQPPPEHYPERVKWRLLLFAWLSWGYRLLLFSGIALLIYHFTFKLLGLLLLLSIITSLILLPMGRELLFWARTGRRAGLNRHSVATLLLSALLLTLLFLPWRDSTSLPALLRHQQQTVLHLPYPAQLLELLAGEGERLRSGAPIARFDSPDLRHRLTLARLELADAQARLRQYRSSEVRLEQQQTQEQRRLEARTRIEGIEGQLRRLTLRTPIDGRLRQLADGLTPGTWFAAQAPIATVVNPLGHEIIAFLPEQRLGAIRAGARGRFIDEQGEGPAIEARLLRIAPTASVVLEEPYVSSLYGGGVTSRRDREGALVPEQGIYRLVFAPLRPPESLARVRRGTLVLETGRRSIAHDLWQRLAALVIRESGF
ncbi:MAG: hypothetical protein B0D88_02610, partial [Candidatus Sedimenticola endophacoides]